MSHGDYADRQHARDREYAAAWEKLSPQQKRELAKAGIQGPELPVYHTRKTDHETCIELSRDASMVTPEHSAADDEPDLPLADRVEGSVAASEALEGGEDSQTCAGASGCDTEVLMAVLRRLLGEMMASDNVRLTLDCLSLITGMSYDGASMREIAKRHQITRSAVSKRCVLIADSLGLPPSRAMRQLTARRVYERRARNSHSRSAH